MAGGVDQLLQIWRELFERTRRTQSRTAHRRLSIIRTERDDIEMDEVMLVDTTQPPATGKWADSATWSTASANVRWGDGTKWS